MIKKVMSCDLMPIEHVLKKRYPSFKGFGDALDLCVYRRGSIRLIGSCKEDAKQVSKAKKILVQACGIVIPQHD